MVEDIVVDYSKTLPENVTTYLEVAGVLLISCVFIFLFINIKKNKGQFIPVLAGILGFAIFGFMTYNMLVVAIVNLIPGIQDLYAENTNSIIVLLAIVQAAMLTVARMVMANLLDKSKRLNKPNSFNLGIGIGIGNIVVYGITIITMIIWCTAIQQDGLEKIFSGLGDEAEIKSVYNSIVNVFDYKAEMWLALAVGYALDMIIQMMLTWLDACATLKKIPGVWHFIGCVINVITIVSFSIYDGTSYQGFLVPFTIKMLLTAAVVVIVLKVTNVDMDDQDRDEASKQRGFKSVAKMGNLSKL